jgi:hypothetical protein
MTELSLMPIQRLNLFRVLETEGFGVSGAATAAINPALPAQWICERLLQMMDIGTFRRIPTTGWHASITAAPTHLESRSRLHLSSFSPIH